MKRLQISYMTAFFFGFQCEAEVSGYGGKNKVQ
nr:MAG TPA: hypothetical protein [Caudoviricetes sp.]